MKQAFLKIISLVLALCIVLSGCAPANPQGSQTTTVPTTEPPVTQAPPQAGLSTDIPEKASEPTLMLHYYRLNPNDYTLWGFWLWPTGGDGQLFEINYLDGFGGVALYPISQIGADALEKGIGIIPRLLSGWTKDCDADRVANFTDFPIDENNYCHIYIIEGDVTLYKEISEELKAEMENMQYGMSAVFASDSEIKITASKVIASAKIVQGEQVVAQASGINAAEAVVAFPEGTEIDLNSPYQAVVTFDDGKEVSAAIDISTLYDTDFFDEMFYYDGELGAIYTASETVFRVWSPISEKITLNIYRNGNGEETPAQYEMLKGEKGVFEYTVSEDLGGKYYTYTVYNQAYPNGAEIVDPYAKSAGLSGLRGQIVDFEALNPEGWEDVEPIAYDRKELTVWETHVSDVTSSETWTGTEANRYKFLGLVESGTAYTQDGVTVTTGFDHIKELGVNAVQLIPIFDQANDETKQVFNWGYNPLNYNVLEGSYSSDPADGYARIREFKQVVQSFNEAGINVIMDVVYNHVNAAAGSNFDVLMPGYYFRYTSSGALSNGSGCGNETASQRSMFRKFMVDSVCFWASEYKLGGYRFDLMGLHDIETMNILTAALKEINPNIVVYGEPWAGGTAALDQSLLAAQKNANQYLGFGQFNDQMRDAMIKSGMNAVTSKGWVTNNSKVVTTDLNKIIAGLKGTTAGSGYTISDPNKTVTYATCHDNYTLYDRIRKAGVTNEETVKRMAVLANSMVFTSNGTTFMLAGEEFLRTKGDTSAAGNSYNASYKVNELDYSRKIAYADVFEIYKTLIAFKQEISALHLEEAEMSSYTVTQQNDGAVIEIAFESNGKTYRIYHANGCVHGFTADLAGYELLLSTVGQTELSATTALKPYETVIAVK